MDWTGWHKQYDTSLVLLARLRIVREQIRAFLDECAAGPIRIVSICAGDGRDVIEALSDHCRRRDVTAWLLDVDAPSLERGRSAAVTEGLGEQIHFLCADATLAASYRDIVPADLIVVSGVLGHQGNAGIHRFLKNLPTLCKEGGSVIWNRHLVANCGARDVLEVRRGLQQLDFEEAHYAVTSRNGFAVGRSRFRGVTTAFDPQRVIFEFIGLDHLTQRGSMHGRPDHDLDGESTGIGSSRQTHGKPARISGGHEGRGGEAFFMSRSDVEQSLPRWFERQALRHADRTALGSGAWQPSYAELNHAANRLAHAMFSRGGAPGDRVALLMQHDAPLIAAMIAVLKTGKTVVVLNATDPPARLERVLNDAEPVLLLTDATHAKTAVRVTEGRCGVLNAEDYLEGGPSPNPHVQVSPGDIAFLVYTSGSTGPPKGVMQSHRSILHKVYRVSEGIGLQEKDKVILLGSLSGGQGVNTTWCALSAGAALCPFPIMDRGIAGLADWMICHGVTAYVSAASVFRHFMRTLEDHVDLHGTRLVWLASEPAVSEDFTSFQKHFGEDCILFHTLASSETGVITQLRLSHGNPVPGERLPVGQAVEDMRVLLLDEEGREVPCGQTGEISVQSQYLFTGYWRDEALTAQRLLHDKEPDGVKTFRTGDRARMGEDGQLVFMGRQDLRVNIHGYRVELSEIEDALAREPSVEKAVVCVSERSLGDVQLTAYVVIHPGHKGTCEVLRQALRGTLPGHMIPAAFVCLNSLPLNAHGKVDREALRLSAPAEPARQSHEPPQTDTEKLLAAIWSEVFERNEIDRQDDFFDLGGDSLVAALVAAKIFAVLHVQLGLAAFADHPTLANLASAVDALRAASPSESALPLVRVPRDTPLPLSFHQERTWKFSQTPQGSAGYTAAGRHGIRGPLDVALLRESMSYLKSRHESLRTNFPVIEGRPVQVVHAASPVDLPLIDLSAKEDPEAEAEQYFRDQACLPFDLACGELQRLILIRLGEREHQLLRIGHHIICDAWSWDVYFKELGLVYEALLRGAPPPLPDCEPLQYADYAAWQRRVIGPHTPAYGEGVSWWEKQFCALPPPLDLPFRRPVPGKDAHPEEGIVKVEVDSFITQRLGEIAREQRTTFFTVRLAAAVALLAAETGQPDVVMGTYVTNRNRVDTQKMFGFFANMVSLRFHFDERLTFRQWIMMTGVVSGGFQARAEIPYEGLCGELRARGVEPPDVRVIFTASDAPDIFRFGGLEFTKLIPRMTFMPWGCTFSFLRRDNRDLCSAIFDANLYNPSGVREFVSRLIRFLDAASKEPDELLSSLLEKSAAVIAER